MAIKPLKVSHSGHHDHPSKVKCHPSGLDEAPVASIDPPQEPSKAEFSQDELFGQVPTLTDLAELLRLERYQRRKCLQQQHELHRLCLGAARASRLLHLTYSIQRTLAECIKAEDKHSFVSLFNALHDTLAGCVAFSPSPVEPVASEENGCIGYPLSPLDRLPPSSRTLLLDFLSKVRCDGHFIAERLTSLSHKELEALLPEKNLNKSSDSIFGSSQRTSSRASRYLGFVADSQTELLASSEFGSPLETLVLAVRGLSYTPLARDAEATDIWSTVCAKLILEQKPGSEKLVPAVIQLWAVSSDWPGKERLYRWMYGMLQRGTPLLDQVNKQSFRIRSGVRTDRDAEDDNRIEAYYQDSVDALLTLVADPTGANLVPEGARSLCLAISQKLGSSPTHKQAFPNFVLTRWLFMSFLPDVMALPEAHGLFSDHFMADSARQRILREVASRCQRAVFEVAHPWKHGAFISADTKRLVHEVAAHFEAHQVGRPGPDTQSTDSPSFHTQRATTISLTAANITAVVHALYPQSLANVPSDRDMSRSGLHSSSSSVSGFSLFQVPGPAMEVFHTASCSPSIPTGIVLSEKYQELPSSDLKLELNVLEGEQLRDACSALEDLQALEAPSGFHDWCMLHTSVGSDKLSTGRESLLDSLGSEDLCNGKLSPHTLVDPYRCKAALEELLTDQTSMHDRPGNPSDQGWEPDNVHEGILQAFADRIANYDNRGDFVAAHTWHRRLERFRQLLHREDAMKLLTGLLICIKTEKRTSLCLALEAAQWCHEPYRKVLALAEAQATSLCSRVESIGLLRDKMWYVAEARTSAAYDEARSVASALKVMGKAKLSNRNQSGPPLRHWNGSKGPANGFHLKTEAQVLEILSAPAGHGGPNKLSDDQSSALSTWMKRNAIENLCGGEERLQRLCLEIRKAVDTLTSDSAATWSSTLFARGQLSDPSTPKSSSPRPFFPAYPNSGRVDILSLQTNVPPSIDSISSASSHPLSARSSRDYLDTRSPTLTNRSSGPFWSPALTDTQSPSSATSVGSSHGHPYYGYRVRPAETGTAASSEHMRQQVRQRVTSLLLSDLMLATFATGSETDCAFWTGLGGELSEKQLRSRRRLYGVSSPDTMILGDSRFDYNNAFRRLLLSFATTCNPYAKLRYLADIDTLLKPYMASRPSEPAHPRTKALRGLPVEAQYTTTSLDVMVDGFRRLFTNSELRPPTIFRDLQYIAALVPSTTLSSTPEGKAFWNATIAILGIKQEACQLMVETADSIIAYHSNNRGPGRTSSTAQQERDSATFTVPSRTPSAEDIGKYTMSHAASLLQITAKEGDAVAQRELATLYLTHPELMDHIIAPLSRPRDVFKEELEGKWRKSQDPTRCDPATMCVAHHWMTLSSLGGDALAKEYLRQREEMDRLG